MLGCHHTLVLIGYQKQSCVSVEKHTEQTNYKDHICRVFNYVLIEHPLNDICYGNDKIHADFNKVIHSIILMNIYCIQNLSYFVIRKGP